MAILMTRRLPAAAWLAAALVGCGTQSSTGGEVVRFLTPSLPAAATGEPYTQEVVLTAGTRPYSLRVVKGTLPTGITLSGRTLTGTPTEAKTYAFTLEASDANLSIVSREYTLDVRATPPASLEWMAPPTEVRGEIRLPFILKASKNVSAIRASIPLPEGVSLVRLEPGEGRPLLVSRSEPGLLRVDAALVQPLKSNKDATVFTAVFQSEAGVRFSGRVGYDLRANGKALVPAVELSRTGTATGTATSAAPGTSPTATPAAPGTTTATPGTATSTGGTR